MKGSNPVKRETLPAQGIPRNPEAVAADLAEGPAGVIVCRAHAPVYPVLALARAQEEEAQVAPGSSAGLIRALKKMMRKELTWHGLKHDMQKSLNSFHRY